MGEKNTHYAIGHAQSPSLDQTHHLEPLIVQLDFSSLSTNDVRDIALQRTISLMVVPGLGRPSFRLWKKGYPGLIKVEAALRRHSILAAASSKIKWEADQIIEYIGSRRISRIVDIGCGHAIFDIFLYRAYQCHLHLVDIETNQEHSHGYSEFGSAYSSLAAAKKLLISNGVPPEKIRTTNPLVEQLVDNDCDVVMSLLSAGFHYPIKTYLSFAEKATSQNGLFIFDARHGVDYSEVTRRFSQVDVIVRSSRYDRLAFVK